LEPLRLDHSDDPRAEPYRTLIRASAPGAGDRFSDLFIAEGVRTIRLLFEREWHIDSLLVADRRLGAVTDLLESAGRRGVVVFTSEQRVLDGIAGWNVHRGVLAVVRRPAPRGVDEVVARAGELLLCVEGVNDLENLGSLFRNAAAFGAGGVVLDGRTADPLYRRSVRVSLGHVLDVPFARATVWPDELVEACRATGRRIVALTPAGSLTLGSLAASDGPWAVMLGAEGAGLSPSALSAAEVRVRIPMVAGVDSVNVATAAAIALYRLARVD
jgi:tRNA G18 (ribose-2'-O)-methylase SpoU